MQIGISRKHKAMSMILAIIVFITFVFVPTSYKVEAKTVLELNQEIADLQAQRNELNENIENLQSEIDKENEIQAGYIQDIALVKEQLDLYQQQIQVVNAKIADNDLEITELNAKIDKKNVEIEEKQAEFDETEALFLDRLDAMYMADASNSMLGLLFGATTFTEFLSINEALKSISENDKDIMKTLSLQKIELEDLKEQLEDDKNAVEFVKAQNLEDKAELESIEANFQQKSDELNNLYTLSETTEANLENNQLALEAEVAKTEQAIEDSQDEVLAILQAQAEAEGTTPPDYIPSSGFIWPTPNAGYVSSPFGPRWGTWHYGMDIAAAGGTPIVASKTGTIIRVQDITTGYGKNIIMSHGDGTYTLYAHCSAMYVTTGQFVEQGDVIAAVGTTGHSTGNHLHFEIRLGSDKYDAVDPALYVRR